MKKAVFCLLPLLCLVLLGAASPPYLHKTVEIFLNDEPLPAAPLTIDVSHARRAEKSGGYEALFASLIKTYSPKEALNYLAKGLGDFLSAECERRRVDPLNATLEWTKKLSTPFIYYEEKPGRAADLTEVGTLVARAMDAKAKRARVYAYTHEIKAQVTKQQLQEITKEVSRFSTSFASSGENRRHNLSLAATAIAGTVLAPGESFSFNATVGERTGERGFREANIVVNGEFKKGVGGGVCQVSTTLYNAVLLASLPIENAAAHSIPVSYVPYSRDCTVSSAVDFRFKNNTAHPLYIAAETKESTLTFVLYGERGAAPCRLESEVVKRIPFRNLYEDGTEVVSPATAAPLSAGREGVLSRLYRVCGGERTLIRENYYAPKNAVYQKNKKNLGTASEIFYKTKTQL